MKAVARRKRRAPHDTATTSYENVVDGRRQPCAGSALTKFCRAGRFDARACGARRLTPRLLELSLGERIGQLALAIGPVEDVTRRHTADAVGARMRVVQATRASVRDDLGGLRRGKKTK